MFIRYKDLKKKLSEKKWYNFSYASIYRERCRPNPNKWERKGKSQIKEKLSETKTVRWLYQKTLGYFEGTFETNKRNNGME